MFVSSALQFVRTQTLSSKHDGDRNSSKIIIVLTDGESLDPVKTKAEAAILKVKLRTFEQ